MVQHKHAKSQNFGESDINQRGKIKLRYYVESDEFKDELLEKAERDIFHR